MEKVFGVGGTANLRCPQTRSEGSRPDSDPILSNPAVELRGFLPQTRGKTAGDTTFTLNLFIIRGLLKRKMFIKF